LGDLPGHLVTAPAIGAGSAAMRSAATGRAPQNWSLRPTQPPRASVEQKAAVQAECVYRTGQRVSHPRFGEGIVISSQINGGDEEVSVIFQEAGPKKLMAGFANLTILG
ncbi:MAG: DNA helicase UvrD, partial [Anaerolineae bacterium]|nr:DNA helicase UvrD [Anaerolineae bacterium]